MRILPVTLLICCFIMSAGTMATSLVKKDAQSTADTQKTTDIPALKKASRLPKPKTDDTMIQPTDTAPAAVRDTSGRFVKKQKSLPTLEQQSTSVLTSAKEPTSAPISAVKQNKVDPGATARCQDGSFSHCQQHSGSCSRHGGVAQWLTE